MVLHCAIFLNAVKNVEIFYYAIKKTGDPAHSFRLP